MWRALVQGVLDVDMHLLAVVTELVGTMQENAGYVPAIAP